VKYDQISIGIELPTGGAEMLRSWKHVYQTRFDMWEWQEDDYGGMYMYISANNKSHYIENNARQTYSYYDKLR